MLRWVMPSSEEASPALPICKRERESRGEAFERGDLAAVVASAAEVWPRKGFTTLFDFETLEANLLFLGGAIDRGEVFYECCSPPSYWRMFRAGDCAVR